MPDRHTLTIWSKQRSYSVDVDYGFDLSTQDPPYNKIPRTYKSEGLLRGVLEQLGLPDERVEAALFALARNGDEYTFSEAVEMNADQRIMFALAV